MSAAPIFLNEKGIGILRLGVFIEIAKVTMTGGGVQVEIGFLDIFSMIPLISCQAKGPFLEDRVATIPQGKGEAETLFLIADPSQTVFVPAISAGTGLVMVKVLPGGADGAVVFPHGSPGSLRQVRAPKPPVFFPATLAYKTSLFSVHNFHLSLKCFALISNQMIPRRSLLQPPV
jgi:hypothetical protein